MQDCSSDSLYKQLLTEEIEETGRKISQLLQTSNHLDKDRRREIRTVLRDAFQTTQEESSTKVLQDALDRLKPLLVELGGSSTGELEQRIRRHDRFGVVDRKLVEHGAGFTEDIHRHTGQIAEDIEAKMKRNLSRVASDESADGESKKLKDTRPLQIGQELRELVVKKHW